ncbi:MAG: hypothetical protein AB2L07_05200 [Thermoanaerobaculaceae bacterium]
MWLRVDLDNGEIFDVLWETVLMACEPEYPQFGGETPEGRAIADDGMRRWGPFLAG